MDWASDEVLSFAIDIIEQFDIFATWFVTHDTHLLERLRANPKFELGIHPNYNTLLMGEAEPGENFCTITKRLLDIVPEARSLRSHSLTQSTHLLNFFCDLGLTHDSNIFIPWNGGCELRPWLNWNGLTRVPYCWEDHIAIVSNGFDLEAVRSARGIKVFDFHPIHVALNTESLKRYEEAKPFQKDWNSIYSRMNRNHGIRTLLEYLILNGDNF